MFNRIGNSIAVDDKAVISFKLIELLIIVSVGFVLGAIAPITP